MRPSPPVTCALHRKPPQLWWPPSAPPSTPEAASTTLRVWRPGSPSWAPPHRSSPLPSPSRGLSFAPSSSRRSSALPSVLSFRAAWRWRALPAPRRGRPRGGKPNRNAAAEMPGSIPVTGDPPGGHAISLPPSRDRTRSSPWRSTDAAITAAATMATSRWNAPTPLAVSGVRAPTTSRGAARGCAARPQCRSPRARHRHFATTRSRLLLACHRPRHSHHGKLLSRHPSASWPALTFRRRLRHRQARHRLEPCASHRDLGLKCCHLRRLDPLTPMRFALGGRGVKW